MEPDAEVLCVAPQRLNLGAARRIRDGFEDVHRGCVVVFGGEREIRTSHLAPRKPKPLERLWAGHLVHQVEVDVEQVGLVIDGTHDMRVPHLLAESLAHEITFR